MARGIFNDHCKARLTLFGPQDSESNYLVARDSKERVRIPVLWQIRLQAESAGYAELANGEGY